METFKEAIDLMQGVILQNEQSSFLRRQEQRSKMHQYLQRGSKRLASLGSSMGCIDYNLLVLSDDDSPQALAASIHEQLPIEYGVAIRLEGDTGGSHICDTDTCQLDSVIILRNFGTAFRLSYSSLADHGSHKSRNHLQSALKLFQMARTLCADLNLSLKEEGYAYNGIMESSRIFLVSVLILKEIVYVSCQLGIEYNEHDCNRELQELQSCLPGLLSSIIFLQCTVKHGAPAA